MQLPEPLKQVQGFYLPAYETHLDEFLRKGPRVHDGPTYQFHKYHAALTFVPKDRRGMAVDVGAHCGLWSRVMAYDFDRLIAFEPVAIHRECWRKNVVGGKASHILFPYALGDHEATVTLHTGPASSGDTYIQSAGEHTAVMKTLDSVELSKVDFLKIDCEGYELYVLKGGERTVRRDKPVIIVEQKPNKGKQFGLPDTAALDLLKSWGAVQRYEYAGDYVMSWD